MADLACPVGACPRAARALEVAAGTCPSECSTRQLGRASMRPERSKWPLRHCLVLHEYSKWLLWLTPVPRRSARNRCSGPPLSFQTWIDRQLLCVRRLRLKLHSKRGFEEYVWGHLFNCGAKIYCKTSKETKKTMYLWILKNLGLVPARINLGSVFVMARAWLSPFCVGLAQLCLAWPGPKPGSGRRGCLGG